MSLPRYFSAQRSGVRRAWKAMKLERLIIRRSKGRYPIDMNYDS
jgi:hypothetical protein